MSEVQEFVKRGLETVEGLLKEGNYVDAARGCREILQVDPGNRKVNKILIKAREFISKEKKELLKKNLPTVKKLYKEGKYAEAIGLGEKLKVSPVLIAKAKRKLFQERKNELRNYLNKGFKAHKDLTKKEEWIGAIGLLNEMQKVDPRNEKIKELLRYDKIKYIDRELHSEVKKSLIENKQFDKLYKFYQKLYFLFPEHEKLLKEIKNAEKLVFKKRRTENKAFVVESLAKTKELLSGKKYESAIQAAKELIKLTDGEQGMGLYKKADTCNNKDTETKLDIAMQTMIATMKEDFGKDPKKFVKI